MALKDQKEVLIAWINGETIQYQDQDTNGSWSDCAKFCEVNSIRLDESTYRIKPKEIVSTTCIKLEFDTHQTYTYFPDLHLHNLRLTWSEDGITLLKAEVI
jgi:hypothetical protein